MARAQPGGWAPWSARQLEAGSFRTVAGIGIATAGFVALTALLAAVAGGAFGDGPLGLAWWGAGSWLEAATRGLTLGYAPALLAYGRQSAERELRVLRGQDRSSGVGAPDPAVLAPDRSSLRVAGVLGAALLPAVGWAAPLVAGRDPGFGETGFERVLTLSYFVAAGWLLSRALVHDLWIGRGFSRLGATVVPLDLLDLAPFRPLVRHGLRTVGLWVVCFVILSLFWVGPTPANPVNLLAPLLLVVVTSGVFVLPMWGAHRRLRDARRAELARIDDALRAARDVLWDSAAGVSSPRLANLAAYRSRIEDVSAWPVDASSIVRFLGFVLLGLGSWVGGALVDELVSALLGAR